MCLSVNKPVPGSLQPPLREKEPIATPKSNTAADEKYINLVQIIKITNKSISDTFIFFFFPFKLIQSLKIDCRTTFQQF